MNRHSYWSDQLGQAQRSASKSAAPSRPPVSGLDPLSTTPEIYRPRRAKATSAASEPPPVAMTTNCRPDRVR